MRSRAFAFAVVLLSFAGVARAAGCEVITDATGDTRIAPLLTVAGISPMELLPPVEDETADITSVTMSVSQGSLAAAVRLVNLDRLSSPGDDTAHYKVAWRTTAGSFWLSADLADGVWTFTQFRDVEGGPGAPEPALPGTIDVGSATVTMYMALADIQPAEGAVLADIRAESAHTPTISLLDGVIRIFIPTYEDAAGPGEWAIGTTC